jgi:hypothetical protein
MCALPCADLLQGERADWATEQPPSLPLLPSLPMFVLMLLLPLLPSPSSRLQSGSRNQEINRSQHSLFQKTFCIRIEIGIDIKVEKTHSTSVQHPVRLNFLIFLGFRCFAVVAFSPKKIVVVVVATKLRLAKLKGSNWSLTDLSCVSTSNETIVRLLKKEPVVN